jgi:hypothetical protein
VPAGFLRCLQRGKTGAHALGAELQILRSDNKRITAELVTALIEASRQLSQQPQHFWADKFNNADVLTGYATPETATGVLAG